MNNTDQEHEPVDEEEPFEDLENAIYSLYYLYRNVADQEGYAGRQRIEKETETRRLDITTMLLQHPDLASVDLMTDLFHGPPLCFLLFCGCRLPVVRSVVEACEARGLSFGDYGEIIADACDYAMDENTIQYLIKKSPSKSANNHHHSILCSALARPSGSDPEVSNRLHSMDTIQMMLDYDLKRRVDKVWIDEALEIACLNGNEDIIQLLFDARDMGSIDSFDIYGSIGIGTLQFSKHLSIILPCIRESLSVQPDEWPLECMAAVYNSLCEETTKIERIHLDVLSSDIISPGQIRRLIESNPTTTEFSFEFGERNDTNICQGVYQGLDGNNTLQKLELRNVLLHVPTLCNLLRNNSSAMRSLRLIDCVFTGTFQVQQSHPTIDSRLEELELEDGTSESSTQFVAVLKQIATIPSIKKLHIGRSPHQQQRQQNFDITEAVVAVLSKGTLEFLNVRRYVVDTNSIPFLKALTENTFLKQLYYEYAPDAYTPDIFSGILKAVESHNSTLKYVNESIHAYMNIGGIWRTDYEKLFYYLQLNRFGRGKARDPSLPLTEFVDLLSNEEMDRAESYVNGKMAPFRHNILFGLLRECPSIWCMADSASTQDRRKRRIHNATQRLPQKQGV